MIVDVYIFNEKYKVGGGIMEDSGMVNGNGRREQCLYPSTHKRYPLTLKCVQIFVQKLIQ